MASTYLSKTFSAGNQKTWTWSGWVKRTGFDASNNMVLFGSYQDASNLLKLQIANTDQIQTYGLSGGVLVCRVLTNSLYRDVNGWYHIVYSLDTTQATSTDRQKLWINGEEVTSFSTRTDPSQNADLEVNDTNSHTIGQMNSGDYFNGVLAHVHFIDGTRYDASAFGETDATTGIWKPKTAPSVTYGTNGFFLKFENSGSMGTDSSGNANNFTVNGTLTQTVDTPSNVFATKNKLSNTGLTLANGNLTTSWVSNDHNVKSTLGMNSGKWYWEVQDTLCTGIVNGICTDFTRQATDTTNTSGQYVYGFQPSGSGNVVYSKTNGTHATETLTVTANDIFSYAFDADNGKLYFAKNGTWLDFNNNSADPVAGTNPLFTGLDTSYTWLTWAEHRSSSGVLNWNFGNGYFGTTAVSSATTDESGLGTFEYTVPTGYYALCTKNINTQEYS